MDPTLDTPTIDTVDAVDTVDTVDKVDEPPLYEPSVDMFGLVAPLLDTFQVMDHEVLMYYIDEEEKGPREVKLVRIVLTDFMF